MKKDAPEEIDLKPTFEQRRAEAIEKLKKLQEEHPTISREYLWELLTKKHHELTLGECPDEC